MPRNCLKSPVSDAPISFLGSVSFGWLHHRGGFVFDEHFFLDPLAHLESERRIHEFVEQEFPRDPVYNLEAHLVRIEGRQHPVVLVGPLQPNLILGACVGATFVFYGDKDPDMSPAPLTGLAGLDRLAERDWSSTWPLSLFLDQIHRMRETLGHTHRIIPPYFWDTTGRATIHGILTTAQKLLGERIFLDMTDNPAFVHELFAWITDAYVAQIRLCAEAAGMTVTGMHIGDCSLCMIGPDQFSEFVLPCVNRLARTFGPLRFHSCGRCDHLLEAFRAIDNLAVLNVGSGTSVRRMREVFGPVRIDLSPHTRLLTFGSRQDIDAFVRRTVAENDGGPLEFQDHLDLAQPTENCLQMIQTLRDLNVSCPRRRIY